MKTKDQRNKYDEAYIDIAKRLLQRGIPNKEVYAIIGVSEPTGISWRKVHPEFDAVFKENNLNKVKLIENQLIKECTGYYYEEVEKTPIYDKRTGANTKKFKVSKVTRKYARASYGAIIFALTNMDPEKWKSKKDIEINALANHPALQTPDSRHKELLELGFSEETLKDMYNKYQKKKESSIAIDAEIVKEIK